MAQQRFHLIGSERSKECKHPHGFPYTGSIPNTGRMVCPMCGETQQEAGVELVAKPPARPARGGPVCPACNGDTEESGTAGRVTCFSCSYEGPPADS